MRIFSPLAFAVLVGCTANQPYEGDIKLGSSAAASSGDAVYVADEDNSALARVSYNGDVTSVVVGLDPKRVARVGDRLFVTLSGERSVAVVHDDGNTMTLESVHEVGAEPWGIVAHPTDSTLYVTLATEDAVVELGLDDLKELRRFDVPGQPRWLAVHPRGKTLWVASAMNERVHTVELESGKVVPVALPDVDRELTGDPELPVTPMTPRLTGDIDISNDGATVALPVLYVDHKSAPGATSTVPYYTSIEVEGIARFNPSVVTFDLANDGTAKGPGHAVLVASRGRVEEPAACDSALDPEACYAPSYIAATSAGLSSAIPLVRGYLASATFSDDSQTISVTVEGGRSVITMASQPVGAGRPGSFENSGSQSNGDVDGKFEPAAKVVVGVGQGARAIVNGPDSSMWTWNFLDRTLTRLDADQLYTELEVATYDADKRVPTWSLPGTIELEPSMLSEDVLEGRELYFATMDSQMSSAGAGVSCATCHFEGRNDGLTWNLEMGYRQTPSLAGEISHTAPFTWTTEMATIAEDAIKTSQSRMGGSGISDEQADKISLFVDYTRDADVALRNSELDSVARGRAIFDSAETQCSTCHSGERLTNNQAYLVDLGVDDRNRSKRGIVDTPTLVGISASGPWLHDGSAGTLREVIDRADAIGMGSTAHLSDSERNDLVDYLRSL